MNRSLAFSSALILSNALFLTACQPDSSVGPTAPVQQKQTGDSHYGTLEVSGGIVISQDLTSDYIPGSTKILDTNIAQKLNRLLISVKVPKYNAPTSIKAVNLFDSSSPTELRAESSEGSYKIYQHEVDLSSQASNQEFQVKYVFTWDDGRQEEHSHTLRKDLIISGEQSVKDLNFALNGETNYFNRIWLAKGAVLRTNGENINVVAQAFYAEGATIESFSEQDATTASAQGVAGKSGGNVSIETDSVQGLLTVYMRGTKGGQGLQGKARDPKDRPQKTTKDGLDAELRYRDPFSVNSLTKQVGPAYEQINPRSPTDTRRAISFCMREPTDGEDATRVGFPGLKGGTGMTGGGSGSFTLTAKKSLGFQRALAAIPGEGGEPGPGGLGGLGEQGGLAGKQVDMGFSDINGNPMRTDKKDIQNSWDIVHQGPWFAMASACSGVGKAGKDAPMGPPGAEGDSGVRGVQNPLCAPLGESAAPVCNSSN